MAELSDIDTTTVSAIAYWNAIDQGGVADISPSETTSASNVTSYTLYDNGLDGTLNLPNGRSANFRVKNDGWFVIWLDRSNDYGTSKGDADLLRGYHDIVDWIGTDTNAPSLSNNFTPGSAIGTLVSELSNSGSIAYDSSDVGLYFYPYSGATTATVLGAAWYSNSGASPSDITAEFSYTSATTRHHHTVTGLAEGSTYVVVSYEGMDLADSSVPDGTAYGAYDVLANNAAPNANTAYGTRVNWKNSNSGTGKISTMVIWE